MYGILLSTVCAVAVLFYFIVWPVVRYYLDPKGLRRYPNLTWFAGISNIPFMIEANRGFRSRRLAELHIVHPVVRIGPNSLSYGDAQAVKDIYGHGTKCIKDDFYNVLSGTHFHLADVVDKVEHQRKRKVLSSAYALKNLEDWEFKVADKVQRLLKYFDGRCGESPEDEQGHIRGQAVDFRAWSNFFTMDAIVDIGLSKSLGFLDRGDDLTTSEGLDGTLCEVGYRESLHCNLTVQSHLIWAYDWYQTIIKWIGLISTKYQNLISKGSAFDGIVLHQARHRLKRYQDGEKLDDFFQALMEKKDGSPNCLEFGEIFAEINIMLNAGSASTAIAINNALYMLLLHPRCLETLRVEIDAVADDDEAIIPFDKIKDLPYLRACLDESMRIYPPTTFGLPRKTPSEGCNILGDFIAGNTSVSMSAYVVHRDEKVFPEAETFRPERWLDDGKKLQPYFITFSAGARGCIGRNISYLEQIMLIAAVVHRYEMELPSLNWRQSRYEHFNLVPGPLPLKLRRRSFETQKSF